MAALITQKEINAELDRLTLSRIRVVVGLCPREPWGYPDLILAIASRETWIQNIDGDPMGPQGNGKGGWQIDKRSWAHWLSLVPAVADGTWGPVVEHITVDGKRVKVSALDNGFCPTLTDGCKQAVAILKDYWEQVGLWAPADERRRAMVASYNAGPGGAYMGWHYDRNVDARTTGGNYSGDVLGRQTLVHNYLRKHRLVP
jgi:hypothetical protein